MLVLQRRFSNVFWTDTEISPTLEAGGGEGGNNLPIVLYSNQNNAQAVDTEISPTLTASMGMGGGYVPMIVERKTYALGVGENAAESEVSSTLRVKEPYGGVKP